MPVSWPATKLSAAVASADFHDWRYYVEETAITVQRALMRLPVEQRAAVVAVDMHGYSVADTARLLGVAEGTVKSRCARARARLAMILGYVQTDSASQRTTG